MNLITIFEKITSYLYKRRLISRMKTIPNALNVLGKVVVGNVDIIIGDNVIIYPNVTFNGNGKIIIGDNVKIGQDVIIYAHEGGGVEIGNNTIIAAQTYIIDSNHSIDKNELIQNQPLVSKKVDIGSDVWIGANVTVVKGAKIGNGAVIGAKALVNSEIEQFSINVGVPARKIEKRQSVIDA